MKMAIYSGVGQPPSSIYIYVYTHTTLPILVGEIPCFSFENLRGTTRTEQTHGGVGGTQS